MDGRFREDKAAEAAALLLQHHGNEMNYMKLIKLLYLIDREALLRWGRPVTFDRFVAMPKGMVLSQTLDLINEGSRNDSRWSDFVSPPEGYSVRLKRGVNISALSRAEEALIREVYEEYGGIDKWALVDLHHQLPEWKDPHGSAIPIEYQDVMRAAGKTALEAARIREELEYLAYVDEILS